MKDKRASGNEGLVAGGVHLDPATLRRHILKMAFSGQTVHVGCAFSLVEVIAGLYSRHLRFHPTDPAHPERDYLVLSKGHGVMAVYACFRELGWLEQNDLDRYFSDGTLLHGLSEAKVPGLEVSSGSLGHGLPIAAGIALGLKRKGSSQRVYCIVGDGEMNEGPIWEALLFAAHHRLSNLVVIVDANRFQAMGPTDEIIGLEPLARKFESFGFETEECDGHDPAALDAAFSRLAKESGGAERPRALVARTVKGKGVSFMEGDNSWHYLRLTAETLEAALRELSP